MKKWLLLCVLLGAMLASNSLYAKDNPVQLYVAINEDNEIEAVTQYDLANIFLGKQTLWDGDIKIYPAMLNEADNSMEYFIETVLNKSVTQYRSYWKRRLFSGGGVVPKTFKRQKDILRYVAKNEGAIGITDKKIEWDGIKYIPLKMVVKK